MPDTKQLFVLRHAKSSWDDPSLDDHDRPLAPRGRRAVELLAQHVRARGIEPTQVLCSSAVRARETLDGVRPGGAHGIEPELYEASGQDLLERLRRVPDEVDSVLIVGHCPAVQDLVLRLADAGQPIDDGIELSDIRRKFPTGALATLAFDGAWGRLAPGRARLTEFVRPRALE